METTREHRRAMPLATLRSATLLYAARTIAVACLAVACGDDIVNLPDSDVGPSGDPPPAGDFDGDGLSNFQEWQGWTIAVDRHGYGFDAPEFLTWTWVSSDWQAGGNDTDGDGLDDYEEFVLGTDPRSPDTDADGLDDREESVRWQTSPVSVDTDGDARGPHHDLDPHYLLFDGYELNAVGSGDAPRTSPTLADTDGDSKTDYEETTSPGHDPLTADLPALEVRQVGDVGVLLEVTYEESLGETKQYGTTLTNGKTTTSGFSTTQTFEVHSETTVSAEVEATAFPPGASAKSSVSSTYGFSYNSAYTANYSSVQTAQRESSRQQEDARTHTESYASGEITMGLEVENRGVSAFTLTNLGVAVAMWQAGTEPPSGGGAEGPSGGEFKTVATLLPELEGGITLAPGETSSVLQVSASEVNAQVVKEFLAHPDNLFILPSQFDLSNAGGIDFDFLTEETLSRTARLELNFGGGVAEDYHVAACVERGPDGALMGITLGEVLRDVLDLEQGVLGPGGYQVTERTVDGVPTGVEVLASLRGHEYKVMDGQWQAFWTLAGSRDEHLDRDFDDVVLKPGDEIRLIYTRDEDLDGLFEYEEQALGTTEGEPGSDDSDGDSLEDSFEAKHGWECDPVLRAGDPDSSGYPKQVFSNPRFTDTDDDGLDDDEEYELKTDPRNPDTDGDGQLDGVDPDPTRAAGRLYVDASPAPPPDEGELPEEGYSWWTAFPGLQPALEEARTRNEDNTDTDDDISEIWVAQGTYLPGTGSADSFSLIDNVAVYGGFLGGEGKLGARDANPYTNGTILSGGGTCFHVVTVPAELDPGPGCRLDGFSVTEGSATGVSNPDDRGGGLLCLSGAPEFENLLFFENEADWGAGAYCEGTPTFVDCGFWLNQADSAGGGMALGDGPAVDDGWIELRGCVFNANDCSDLGIGASGGLHVSGSGAPRVNLEECVFSGNLGAMRAVAEAGVILESCRIVGNQQLPNEDPERVAGIWMQGQFSAINCLFRDNAGRAIVTEHDTGSRIVNCTIAYNAWEEHEGSNLEGMGLRLHQDSGLGRGMVQIRNCVLWGNDDQTPSTEDSPSELDQLYAVPGLGEYLLEGTRFSCIQDIDLHQGNGNIGSTDPSFAGLDDDKEDLPLLPDSPCVDAGFNLVDIDPWTPGFQPLPATDLLGYPRVTAGGAGATPTVDMGACERPPSN